MSRNSKELIEAIARGEDISKAVNSYVSSYFEANVDAGVILPATDAGTGPLPGVNIEDPQSSAPIHPGLVLPDAATSPSMEPSSDLATRGPGDVESAAMGAPSAESDFMAERRRITQLVREKLNSLYEEDPAIEGLPDEADTEGDEGELPLESQSQDGPDVYEDLDEADTPHAMRLGARRIGRSVKAGGKGISRAARSAGRAVAKAGRSDVHQAKLATKRMGRRMVRKTKAAGSDLATHAHSLGQKVAHASMADVTAAVTKGFHDAGKEIHRGAKAVKKAVKGTDAYKGGRRLYRKGEKFAGQHRGAVAGAAGAAAGGLAAGALSHMLRKKKKHEESRRSHLLETTDLREVESELRLPIAPRKSTPAREAVGSIFETIMFDILEDDQSMANPGGITGANEITDVNAPALPEDKALVGEDVDFLESEEIYEEDPAVEELPDEGDFEDQEEQPLESELRSRFSHQFYEEDEPPFAKDDDSEDDEDGDEEDGDGEEGDEDADKEDVNFPPDQDGDGDEEEEDGEEEGEKKEESVEFYEDFPEELAAKGSEDEDTIQPVESRRPKLTETVRRRRFQESRANPGLLMGSAVRYKGEARDGIPGGAVGRIVDDTDVAGLGIGYGYFVKFAERGAPIWVRHSELERLEG